MLALKKRAKMIDKAGKGKGRKQGKRKKKKKKRDKMCCVYYN